MEKTFVENTKSFQLNMINGKFEPILFINTRGKNITKYKKNNILIKVNNKKIETLYKKDIPNIPIDGFMSFIMRIDDFIQNKLTKKNIKLIYRGIKIEQKLVIRTINSIKKEYIENVFTSQIIFNYKNETKEATIRVGNIDRLDLIFDKVEDIISQKIKDNCFISNKTISIMEEMDIILAKNSGGGVLIHEAIGHGLEDDIYKDGYFQEFEGKEIFHKDLIISDDPLLHKNLLGSFEIDDEGEKAKKVFLIKDGKINETMKNYYNNKEETNGHGRRETFKDQSLVRMSNTIMGNGKDKHDDIIKSVKRGIYITSIGGGQVDVKKGDFVFQGKKGLLIEDGKIQKDIIFDNISLKGNGIDVLKNIEMIGDDLDIELSNMITHYGYCGKGQTALVTQQTPTFKTKILVSIN